MVLLSKDEAFAMREQGLQDFVKMSRSRHRRHRRHPKYYLVEDTRCLKALEKYRKSKKVEEHKI